MSSNSNKRKKSNRKRQRRHQNKTTRVKHMKIDEADPENDNLQRHIIQFSESIKDRFSIKEEGGQDSSESLVTNNSSLVKVPDEAQSEDRAFIKAIEQMSSMICEKLDQNNKLLQQLLSKSDKLQPA